MPILEAMNARWFDRLVFEWSFDIDRSIPRFNAVVEKLATLYKTVWFGSFDQTQPSWPGSWFPPARNVWCYDGA